MKSSSFLPPLFLPALAYPGQASKLTGVRMLDGYLLIYRKRACSRYLTSGFFLYLYFQPTKRTVLKPVLYLSPFFSTGSAPVS